MKTRETKLTIKQKYYKNILEIDEEIKEYKLYCENKSTKFENYNDWRKHIKKEFSKVTSKELDNYKRYLINKQRSEKDMLTRYATVFMPYVTITINNILPAISKNAQTIWSILLVISIIFLVASLNIVKSQDRANKEYYFYQDVIEIIEEIQREKEKSSSNIES